MAGTTHSRPIRYIAELVVVFVGVWLSLLAENYRQEVSERAAERVSVGRLLQDLEWDQRDIQGNLGRAAVGEESGKWLVEHAELPGTNRDSISLHLTRLQNVSIFVPNASEYTSLKGSGRVNLLQDPELRRAVTQLYESYPLLSALQEADYPALIEAMETIAPSVRVRLPNVNDYPSIEVLGDPDTILRDPTFLMKVIYLTSNRRYLQKQYESTLVRIREIQEMGQAVLDGG